MNENVKQWCYRLVQGRSLIFISAATIHSLGSVAASAFFSTVTSYWSDKKGNCDVCRVDLQRTRLLDNHPPVVPGNQSGNETLSALET
uniref:Uncharacterized protein n=1 Tax=Ciona intestinalis TaxID=7719 RepID=F6VSJ9_CIOIN